MTVRAWATAMLVAVAFLVLGPGLASAQPVNPLMPGSGSAAMTGPMSIPSPFQTEKPAAEPAQAEPAKAETHSTEATKHNDSFRATWIEETIPGTPGPGPRCPTRALSRSASSD